MLQIKNITKVYKTSSLEQKALDGVSIKFRNSEFVSILGQSGSGKTTLLNIIGGLDEYTSGDLIINGKSTKKFKDKDWDKYRNHSVGFVFQSYNLIPHQTALSNVELALTLSGVNKEERKRRAIEVLDKVGLKDHIHKKPNQMSGGQMQRIAIARALINDPDILLADEPTGALDTKTSVQIMDLLKEIAKDRLVIMVTHNPELAEKYSTRIIKLSDGKIIDDSNPLKKDDKSLDNETKHKKVSMSFLTALSLSLNNLMTKKGRTILTAFAGSIGIIGIALILSLSSGVRNYINKVQEDTLSSYPITIEDETIDASSMLEILMKDNKKEEHKNDKVYSNNVMNEMINTITAKIQTNNLNKFKKFLESDKSDIKKYTSAIQYGYNLDLQIYNSDTKDGVVKANPTTIFDTMGFGDMMDQNQQMMGSQFMQTNVFTELIDNQTLLKGQYDLLAGSWPTKYNEMVLILDENNEISDYTLYAIGLKNQDELKDIMDKVKSGKTLDDKVTNYEYSDFLNYKFKVLLNTDYYKLEKGNWVDYSDDEDYLKEKLKDALEIKITGIVKIGEDTKGLSTSGMLGYTKDLTEYVINNINNSEIVKKQKENKDINVFTGLKFEDSKEFNVDDLSVEEQLYLSSLSNKELSDVIENYSKNAGATYESNLEKLGVVDLDTPSQVNIYASDFESKDQISEIIREYNSKSKEEDKINYTDMLGLMMSSVTSIVNIISYVLIAFVGISLVVSSIMIGIITYISVLERTKEIGILRAIGASKKDVSRVFNAETLIIGLTAGLIGVLVTILLNIPINLIIKQITGISTIAKLPYKGAIILVVISMILTVIAGLIPSKLASKKDPVEALRSE